MSQNKLGNESPDKMDECEVTTDEEGNISKTPSRFGEINTMPDISNSDSEISAKADKKQKVIKTSAISKIKKPKKTSEADSQPSAFSYQERKEEEVKLVKKPSPKLSKEADSDLANQQTKQIYDEVKDLRLKIRALEDEKRALKEETIKLKQE